MNKYLKKKHITSTNKINLTSNNKKRQIQTTSHHHMRLSIVTLTKLSNPSSNKSDTRLSLMNLTEANKHSHYCVVKVPSWEGECWNANHRWEFELIVMHVTAWGWKWRVKDFANCNIIEMNISVCGHKGVEREAKYCEKMRLIMLSCFHIKNC